MNTYNNIKDKLIIVVFILISSSSLKAGEGPWISPDQDYVIGINKTLNVYTGGGTSDEPDYEPSCPPWNLTADTTSWNWSVNGPGQKSGNADQITITATGIGMITVKVNRNDKYEDGSNPPEKGDGVPSDDSEKLTIKAVEVKDEDPEKAWYYFGNPSAPKPADIELNRFSVSGSAPPQGSRYDWSEQGNKATFQDSSAGNFGQIVKGTSTGFGDVEIEAKWGNENLGRIDKEILKFGQIKSAGSSAWAFNYAFAFGWITEAIYQVLDQNGASLESDIGVNERLHMDQTLDYISNNWHANGAITNTTTTEPGGYFTDQYKIRSILNTRVPAPVDYKKEPSIAAIEVFSFIQDYYIGSISTEDGIHMLTHVVRFCKGYATVDSPY